jgi:hypothetical protein
MNKKKLVIIILIIAAVSISIIGVIINKQAKKSKLSNIYEKMIENKIYTFTRYDLEEKNKIITSRKKDKTLIDMYNSGEHLSTLILEGDTYLIFHENEEYFVYTNNNKDEELLTSELAEIAKLEYTIGKEKIYGKSYKYEEYKGVSNFLIYSENNMDIHTVKTRFYFKGKELVYLKTMYETVNQETGERKQVEELQNIKVEYEVPDGIFNIPENYAEN